MGRTIFVILTLIKGPSNKNFLLGPSKRYRRFLTVSFFIVVRFVTVEKGWLDKRKQFRYLKINRNQEKIWEDSDGEVHCHIGVLLRILSVDLFIYRDVSISSDLRIGLWLFVFLPISQFGFDFIDLRVPLFRPLICVRSSMPKKMWFVLFSFHFYDSCYFFVWLLIEFFDNPWKYLI